MSPPSHGQTFGMAGAHIPQEQHPSKPCTLGLAPPKTEPGLGGRAGLHPTPQNCAMSLDVAEHVELNITTGKHEKLITNALPEQTKRLNDERVDDRDC